MTKLLTLAVVSTLAARATPTHVGGFCQTGGQQVSIVSLASSSFWQQSYPLATVSIFAHGTASLATIYSDALSTPKANPFTAGSDASYNFYANGSVDVQCSGSGIVSPFTFFDQASSVLFANVQAYGAKGDGSNNDSTALNACLSAGGNCYLPAYQVGSSSPAVYKLTSIISVPTGANIYLDAATISCQMSDPGTSSGCFVPTGNNISFYGTGTKSLITQGNNANIQTLIFVGANQNIQFHHFAIDGNEGNQTATGGFYSCFRSAAGAADLMFDHLDITGCGDRALDIRGTNRTWVQQSFFHTTGVNIAGQGLSRLHGGNPISLDVDGTTISTDGYIIGNQFEIWGDAIACGHALRCHITNNILRGAADFGLTPTAVESGIDITGSSYVDVIGNMAINVRGPVFTGGSQTVAAVNYIPSHIRAIGNHFYATVSSLASSDPRVALGDVGLGTSSDYVIANNEFVGYRLELGGMDQVVIQGNVFHNILSSVAGGIVIDLNPSVGGGPFSNLAASDNIFTTDNASMSILWNVSSRITAPGLRRRDSYLRQLYSYRLPRWNRYAQDPNPHPR